MSLTRTLTRLPISHPKATSAVLVAGFSFFLGSVFTTWGFILSRSKKKLEDRENAGASREFQDQSLFYGDENQLTKVERNNR